MNGDSSISQAQALGCVPDGLRSPLLGAFNRIVQNFREGRWEPSELNGGKLCELVYSILRGHIDGRYPPRPPKVRDFVTACRSLEQADKNTFSQSVRITIPRVLVALYELRNNRNVAHTGGDVDPNKMDAMVVLQMAKWVMGELVRHFHQTDTDTAREVVEALAERTIPLIWSFRQTKRVLNPALTLKEKTLLLLYSSAAPVPESDLFRWVEHSDASVYRRDVLVALHEEKMIEYDRFTREIHLLPPGTMQVEADLLALDAAGQTTLV